MPDPREYWAFVSYRHLDNKDPGREWATWIAREIETYEVPADLVGTTSERGEIIPERLYPVFRDEDELSAGADLSSPIYQALQQSKSLVVICSPRAIDSRYVGNEIAYYKTLARPCGALAMMIEGEPHSGDERECFPKELKHPVDVDGKLDTSKEVEPIAADFRLADGGQGWHSLAECRKHLDDENAVSRYRQQCELAKLKVIAGILGVPLGQLAERDKAYQLALAKKRTRIITRVAAAMTLLAALAIAAGIFASQKRQQAIKSQAAAEQTRDAAEGLVEDIIFDLRDKLQDIGQLELLADSATAAEEYFAKLPPSMITDESERRRSVVLDTRAEVLEHTGNLDGALLSSRAGLEIARRLAAKAPDDVKRQQDVAISLQEIADILFAQNLPGEAKKSLIESESTLKKAIDATLGNNGADALLSALLGEEGDQARNNTVTSIEANPGLADLFASAAVITERIGNISQSNGDAPDALAHYRTALKVQRAMAVAQPEKDYWRRGQLTAHNKIGNLHLLNGDLAAARGEFEKSAEMAEQEVARHPDKVEWKDLYANGLDRLAAIDSQEGKIADAIKKSQRAVEIWRDLAASDPTNLSRKRRVFVGLHKLGPALAANGSPSEAILKEARTIARQLVDADPTNAVWRRDLAFSLDRLAGDLSASGNAKAAIETATEALGHHRQLADGDPDNLFLRRNLFHTLNSIAINQWLVEELESAAETFQQSAVIAASIIDGLVQPTRQSYKDLGDVCHYTAQVYEQAGEREQSLNWYRKAFNVVTSAHELGLVEDNIDTEKLQPLRNKIAELEAQ